MTCGPTCSSAASYFAPTCDEGNLHASIGVSAPFILRAREHEWLAWQAYGCDAWFQHKRPFVVCSVASACTANVRAPHSHAGLRVRTRAGTALNWGLKLNL